METELTKQIKTALFRATAKQGVFGCFEVTIGWFGNERVDYMTYDTKGVFRFYEIKISKSDFRSDNHNTFLGHFNYYVMPSELYEQLKTEIPAHIGVLGENGRCIKKAKRQELGEDVNVLKNSLIRSLCREAEKLYRSGMPTLIEQYKQMASRAERRQRDAERRYSAIYQAVQKYERANGVEIEW